MIKSFVLLGQSNMAGRGYMNGVPPIINERILMLRNGRWQMMAEPIHFDRPVAGVGLAASFAGAWCQSNAENQIGLIPCADGGSSIDEWSVDGPLYQHAVSTARFALENSELAGILWHQGENDCHGGAHRMYKEKLKKIIYQLREDLNAPDALLIIGELGGFLGKTGFGKTCVEYALVNEQLKQFANENANCYFVTAEGLTCNPDGIHIDAASHRRFGLRYFDAYNTQSHICIPSRDEKERLAEIQNRVYSKNERIYMLSISMVLNEINYDDFEAQLQTLNQ